MKLTRAVCSLTLSSVWTPLILVQPRSPVRNSSSTSPVCNGLTYVCMFCMKGAVHNSCSYTQGTIVYEGEPNHSSCNVEGLRVTCCSVCIYTTWQLAHSSLHCMHS